MAPTTTTTTTAGPTDSTASTTRRANYDSISNNNNNHNPTTSPLLQDGLDEEEEEEIIHQTRRYQPGDPLPIHDDDDDEEEDRDGLLRDTDYEDDDEEPVMTIQELLYSSSSYYAIAKPVCLTMILSALAVVFINTDELRQQGQQAMATAYQVWNVQDNTASSSETKGETLALSLANALVMILFVGTMTFVIVFLYRMRCMKCLIGYMVLCSTSLLGVLGANLLKNALLIYHIPVDQGSFYLFMVNFALVGVLAVFWGQGIPRTVTQGYLMATSVILAWHLSFFDDWTAWCLLFMLALYDLCAVLSSFGPLRALVEAMSEEDAPDMPGLLFEAQLPPEAKKPGAANNNRTRSTDPPLSSSSTDDGTGAAEPLEPTATNTNDDEDADGYSGVRDARSAASEEQPPTTNMERMPTGLNATLSEVAPHVDTNNNNNENNNGNTTTAAAEEAVSPEDPVVTIPLAIAQVYRLPVVAIPPESRTVMAKGRRKTKATTTTTTDGGAEPLLVVSSNDGTSLSLPDNPTASQLRADVTVRMPAQGGRLERVKKRGRRVYLERDRHGQPKRLLWVDRSGKVFAELRNDDDEDDDSQSSIRLGLGDFIFYSVLVSKAAQYSFATFAACTLVILAGLGGTLLLLAMYHQALPALPISILLGIVTYLLTRLWMEPWIEAVLSHPYYV